MTSYIKIENKMAFLARSWRLFAVSWHRAAVLRSYSATAGNKDEIMMKEEKQNVVEVVSPDELVSVGELSGVPKEQLERRVARIYMPARNTMQSGTENTHHWQLMFNTQERWENPLMGWASSADPLSNVSLKFDSKEEAIAYAVKNGWGYEVEQPKRPRQISKSYGANFSWDKKTRVLTK